MIARQNKHLKISYEIGVDEIDLRHAAHTVSRKCSTETVSII